MKAQPLIIPPDIMTSFVILDEIEDGIRRMDYLITVDLPALLGHSINPSNIASYGLKFNAAGGMVIEFALTENQP